jgi:2-amino-4-hydroxy-6-hydroxymethyldihydropteridine diphosphokinase / dihydropteroate synthase
MFNQLVALGIGSNLDSPIEFLRKALQEIKKISSIRVQKVASIYESDAQLPDNAPAGWNLQFLNSVILCAVEDSLKPLELLYILKKIEIKMGRLSKERWAPRTIDIDILYWEDIELNHEELVLPHPRLTDRPFALLPLLEVLPQAKVNKPIWAQEWIAPKPFNTVRSARYFWPQFVAVMNITTDSFSDGGHLLNAENLLLHAEKQLKAGATILDIGAESTRPKATFVSPEVEFKNLKWAFEQLRPLKKKYDFKFSLDCRHSDIVRQVLDLVKVDFLNDVTGFNSKEMQKLLKASKADAFVMHSLTIPPTAEDILPTAENPFEHLTAWWKKKKAQLIEAGIPKENLVFDPGIGFGKNAEQNIFILKNLDQLSDIEESILVGHSRKSYQKVFSDRSADQRDLETALVTNDLNKAYTQFLRVHDVETQMTALRF